MYGFHREQKSYLGSRHGDADVYVIPVDNLFGCIINNCRKNMWNNVRKKKRIFIDKKKPKILAVPSERKAWTCHRR